MWIFIFFEKLWFVWPKSRHVSNYHWSVWKIWSRRKNGCLVTFDTFHHARKPPFGQMRKERGQDFCLLYKPFAYIFIFFFTFSPLYFQSRKIPLRTSIFLKFLLQIESPNLRFPTRWSSILCSSVHLQKFSLPCNSLSYCSLFIISSCVLVLLQIFFLWSK